MSEIRLDYAIEDGTPRFDLEDTPNDLLICLIIDAAATIGARKRIPAPEVLLRLVADYLASVDDEARLN